MRSRFPNNYYKPLRFNILDLNSNEERNLQNRVRHQDFDPQRLADRNPNSSTMRILDAFSL